MHPAALSIDRLLKECSQQQVRRSGPGGQHRNKVESGIVLRHDPTGVSAEASERRTRRENYNVAVARLRRNLALQVRHPVPGEEPSANWKGRVSGGRIAINPHHELFPALLAEALDNLAQCDWDISAASERLAMTSSQLVKFLKREPRALELLNAERATRQLRPLR